MGPLRRSFILHHDLLVIPGDNVTMNNECRIAEKFERIMPCRPGRGARSRTTPRPLTLAARPSWRSGWRSNTCQGYDNRCCTGREDQSFDDAVVLIQERLRRRRGTRSGEVTSQHPLKVALTASGRRRERGPARPSSHEKGAGFGRDCGRLQSRQRGRLGCYGHSRPTAARVVGAGSLFRRPPAVSPAWPD